MRIQVCGYSGSGKSTLSKKLGQIYNVKVLHIDTIHFEPNWVIRDNNLMEEDIKKFLEENDSWVIDGNYYRHNKERFDLADKIIYLKFNRWTCFFRTLFRSIRNKGVQRDDMAEGCLDKPSFSFSMWVLFGVRKKKITKRFFDIVKNYKEKVVILKNRKQLDNYLKGIIDDKEKN